MHVSSTYGSRGDVEAMAGPAARLGETGEGARVCAPLAGGGRL